MSILAEPRRKQRISVDPRNLQWKNDEAKFGKKMMERMGWKNGNGLGKSEQGRNDNLKLKVNYSGKGLGCDGANDETWVAAHDDFADLLASLNKGKPGTSTTVPERSKEKSRKNRMRIRYRRFTRGSDLSEYTEGDKHAVLGAKKRSHADEQSDDTETPQEKTPKVEEGNVIESTLSVNEYFAEKMRKIREKSKAKQEKPDE